MYMEIPLRTGNRSSTTISVIVNSIIHDRCKVFDTHTYRATEPETKAKYSRVLMHLREALVKGDDLLDTPEQVDSENIKF
jgi:hypothetical protein